MKAILLLLLFVSFAFADQRRQPPNPGHPLNRAKKPKAPNSGVKIDFLKAGRMIRERLPRERDPEKEAQLAEEEKQARIRQMMEEARKEHVSVRPHTRGSS